MKKQGLPPLAFHASKHLERRKPPLMVIVALLIGLLSVVGLVLLWLAVRHA